MDKLLDIFLEFPIYYVNYVGLVLLTLFKAKAIWKAACGGNGQIQLTELAQLFALYFFFAYCNEVIFKHLTADMAMVLMFLGVLGVAGYHSHEQKKLKTDGSTGTGGS